MSSSSRPKVEWFGFVNDFFLHLNRTMTALCPSVLNREPACTLYPLLCNNTGFLLAICCPAPDLAAASPAHALPGSYAKHAGAGRRGGMHLQGSSEGPPRRLWHHGYLPPFSLAFSHSVCFRTAPYKFWKFQDVSRRQGQCFRTDFQSFRMVQNGFQDVSGWQSDFSLISVWCFSVVSVWRFSVVSV